MPFKRLQGKAWMLSDKSRITINIKNISDLWSITRTLSVRPKSDEMSLIEDSEVISTASCQKVEQR